MTEHLNIQIIKRRGSSPWPPGESRQALVKMLLFPSAIYSLLTCGSVFLDVWGNCHTLQMRSCFDAGISASAREEWYQLSGLFRLNEVALVPWTGIHFPLFPGWSVCTITLIRMNSNVFLTPIVLTVCGIFHSSGTSHYLAAQILWQRRSTPASQVYEWQRGLRPWPYTSLNDSSQSHLKWNMIKLLGATLLASHNNFGTGFVYLFLLITFFCFQIATVMRYFISSCNQYLFLLP